ncbi:MAG: hypothetical protein ACRDP5_27120 [Streptosporangiaceae bacterium]
MCDTCPAHIPGPGEVGSGLLGAAVGAAVSKPGRKVLFWGIAVPMLPFAVVGVFGWWTIALVAVLAAATAAGLLLVRKLHRHVLVVAPPSLRNHTALPAATRARVITTGKVIRPAQAISAPRRALPAAGGIPAQRGEMPPARSQRAR